jgi:hypothetical protein
MVARCLLPRMAWPEYNCLQLAFWNFLQVFVRSLGADGSGARGLLCFWSPEYGAFKESQDILLHLIFLLYLKNLKTLESRRIAAEESQAGGYRPARLIKSTCQAAKRAACWR